MAQIIGKYYCSNLEETKKVATELAKTVTPSTVYAFYGDLGAGKTTFIQTILRFFNIPKEQIQSPTFSYLHSYEDLACSFDLYHFDLYRLNSEKDFFALGFEEYLTSNGICFIEWAGKIKKILPIDKTININIHHIGEHKREIEILYA